MPKTLDSPGLRSAGGNEMQGNYAPPPSGKHGTIPVTGTYKILMSSQSVSIHPSSVLCGKKPKCIVFGELIHTTRNYARQVTAVDPSWLPELAPSVFTKRLSSS